MQKEKKIQLFQNKKNHCIDIHAGKKKTYHANEKLNKTKNNKQNQILPSSIRHIHL